MNSRSVEFLENFVRKFDRMTMMLMEQYCVIARQSLTSRLGSLLEYYNDQLEMDCFVDTLSFGLFTNWCDS